ncbi:MAG: penicillin-binding protein [Actinobacteria bacterium]|uniref:beta-lactamase n=1 Tax=freshwater metagenome TaxID=449393 RepID=A0A6J6R8R9_9ZZZZ|nr:penicillin-binding protein [Actinomycetota bacterium]
MPRTPLRVTSRVATALVALVVAVAALGGCDQVADQVSGPDPAPAMQALADGLAAGDLAEVPLVGGSAPRATTAYAALVEGLGDVSPSVSAGEISEDGDTATGELGWTWVLDGQEWTYLTQVELTRDGDAWGVVWSPSVVESSLAEGEVLESTPIGARRGDVLGARGLALVTARPVTRFGIDRSQVPARRAGESARRLAALLDIDPVDYVKRVDAAGELAFVEGIVYRRDEVPTAVSQGYRAIEGAVALTDDLPLPPSRGFAGPILGTVGEVTAEMIEDDPDTYRIGDEAGLSGLQARYDDELRGMPGVVVDAVAGEGESATERELFRVEPTQGDPLQLTLDLDLQTEAEALLAGVAPASALVAIRPSTGAILAAANGPGTAGYNTATFGQAAPGSTFKIVSSLALLRSGLTPSSAVPCTTSVTVDGKRFTNYSDYPSGATGQIPLSAAVANSCNTAFISQTDRLGGTDLFDAAVSLGLGLDHDLGFPAYFGSVEPPASETEAAADMIGQGTILASPMVMATVIASVQQGATVVPHLVDGYQDVAPDGAAPLSKAEAAALRSMLRGVVTSGSGRGLADLPGPAAIAKTGTAEFARDGRILTHAWMVAAQGDLAVAVYVEVGDSGSGTAGPILEAFLRAAR